MKNEKILETEKISDEELNEIVGGYDGGGDDKKFFKCFVRRKNEFKQ